MSTAIDLHGLTHDEALLETEAFLFETSVHRGGTVTIVTGNSHRLQEKIIKQILDVYDFKFYIPSDNLGVIKVIHQEL